MSLRDAEEDELQQAIAVLFAEAENNNKASSACDLMNDWDKTEHSENNEPMVHDDLIDPGQHDLPDSAPASTYLPPTTEEELRDVFHTVTMAASFNSGMPKVVPQCTEELEGQLSYFDIRHLTKFTFCILHKNTA